MASAQALECNRELEINKSADEVWEYLSNIRHVMTANQFHVGLDCDPTDVLNPKAGLDVPIIHEVMGWRHVRIARITKFENYQIAWGERVPEEDAYEDPFPHSEGWTVEPRDAGTCLVRNRLRGRYTLPVGDVIGKFVWDTIIPPILDNDLQDLALAVGAVEKKKVIEIPTVGAAMLRLSFVRTFDGVPDTEFFNVPPLKAKHDA